MTDISFKGFFEGIKGKTICVVGDFIVDHYRTLTVKGVSPESPTLMFRPSKDEYRPGGAGNVCANLRAWGVKSHVMTVIGDGHFPLEHDGIGMVCEKGRLTTTKERLLTRRQQLMRVDIQSDREITRASADELLRKALCFMEGTDAIVFSDYAHGVCVPNLIIPLMQKAISMGIPTVVDSKARDSLSKYFGCTIMLPNQKEARLIAGFGDEFEDEHVARFLLRKLRSKALGLTLGPDGIMLFTEGKTHFPALNEDTDHEVTDVTGAGDTVSAIVAAGLVLGWPLAPIMKLANVAAGTKVQKMGVATPLPDEIVSEGEKRGIRLLEE